MGRITINLSNGEKKLKEMIKSLIDTDTSGNRFYKRSESEVAKMILEPALREEYKKYVQKINRGNAP